MGEKESNKKLERSNESKGAGGPKTPSVGALVSGTFHKRMYAQAGSIMGV